MAYLAPSEFVTKWWTPANPKIFMSTRDTVIRAYMAGAILALAAWFAITITVKPASRSSARCCFRSDFVMLYLLGFDLLTGVFVLTPLALIDKRPGVTHSRRFAKLGPRLCRQLRRRFHRRLHDGVRDNLRLLTGARQGRRRDRQHRRSPYARLRIARRGRHGDVVPPRYALQLDGFDRRRRRHDLHYRARQGHRDVDADPGVLLHGVRAFRREHVPVSVGTDAAAPNSRSSTICIWNEIPTVVGNLVGGLAFTG